MLPVYETIKSLHGKLVDVGAMNKQNDFESGTLFFGITFIEYHVLCRDQKKDCLNSK